ncbi:MAG: sulfatase [Deltaproteobacteria bacterium]|nr:sulfatase [Deltaproteobacteria bacterium]
MSRKGDLCWRIAVGLVLAVLVAGGITYQLTRGDDPPTTQPESPSRPPHVLFVVVDMLRADHLSLCGYERPTTPNLNRLARRPHVASTCRAYAPGTWTLPSHASFFTGEEVPVHGADSLGDPEGKQSVSLWGDPVRPLAASLPTLAERFSNKGYRTVMVSGNPIVSRWAKTGLDRGFDVVEESRSFGDLYGQNLITALERALDRAGDDQPLFLFINICDAHHPWRAVPPGIKWVDPRPPLDNRPRFPETPYPRFLRGQMPADEKAAFLEHARDSYDHAVWRADQTFGKLIQTLKSRGVGQQNYRLVVTSDHGEFLGEHDLLSHAIFVYEPDTRVPLIFLSSEAGGDVDFPEPISALTSHDLALDGRLPEPARPVRAVGYPDALMGKLFGERLRATTAAWWFGNEKLFWINDQYSRFDLAADTQEANPGPLPDEHPLRARFEAFVEQTRATANRSSEPTPEMIEALRALGYVE